MDMYDSWGDIHDYNVSENLYQKPSGKRTTAGIWHPVQYRWNLLKCLPVCRKIFCRNVKRFRCHQADAFNNLSDAGSSFITLAGFLYAGKTPDSEHPFGHGRFEYVSGFVVAIAILMMGFELLKTSFSKICIRKP